MTFTTALSSHSLSVSIESITSVFLRVHFTLKCYSLLGSMKMLYTEATLTDWLFRLRILLNCSVQENQKQVISTNPLLRLLM